jgi:plasmid maintenance system antidote protein VapI
LKIFFPQMEIVDNKQVGERLAWLEEHLRFKSRRAFALSIDADPAFFDKIVKNKAKLPSGMAKNIEQKYGVSLEWLQRGSGNPFDAKQQDSLEDVIRRVDSNLEQLLKGQDDILNNATVARGEIRAVARYLILKDSKEDEKAMAGLWEIYRKLVGREIKVSD